MDKEKCKKKNEKKKKKNLTKVWSNKRTNSCTRNYIHTSGSNKKNKIERERKNRYLILVLFITLCSSHIGDVKLLNNVYVGVIYILTKPTNKSDK